MRSIGGMLFGHLGDPLGRKRALQRSMVVNRVETEEQEQAVHGLQRFAARERRIAPSCVASGIAWARAVATIKRSAGSP
jgi:hypothetical protein